MDKTMLEKIFSDAIEREIESFEFYQTVSQRVTNQDVKRTFEELAQEELGHKALLTRFREDPDLLTKINIPSQDYKVAEATELPKFDINMKPADAIALAMKKEEEAVKFYRGMAAISQDEEIKKQFEYLAGMELGHKTRLENVFVEIGYPEVF
ncbi:MAG: ferritin family protein [Syntrophales bacterium]|nr:ferritin family protein [Syntrophales bacterium]NLN61079.1 ferritin family protein [Deltaproteobacteria bacterium]